MLNFNRTDSGNADFQMLVKELDTELKIRNGADHAFFAQYNKIDMIKHAIIAYEKEVPVGIGAIKQYAEGIMEVKRMYVPLAMRGKGIAGQVLSELEKWAKELSYEKCILETGLNQPEAIALYKKCKYSSIPNYGQYANSKLSVCFEKIL